VRRREFIGGIAGSLATAPFLAIRRAEDIAPAIEALNGQANALYVVGDALVVANQARIITLALGAHLPVIFNNRDYVQAGGLMSYGRTTRISSAAPPN
jgi:ABC-type uncharacterized transport system substrate-binding protein